MAITGLPWNGLLHAFAAQAVDKSIRPHVVDWLESTSLMGTVAVYPPNRSFNKPPSIST